MSIEKSLRKRSQDKCELCAATESLRVMEVSPSDGSAEKSILLCATCEVQINGAELDANHWRCLNDSMWSQEAVVQVISYRMLHKLSVEYSWAQDLIDMMYLEDEIKAWADEGIEFIDPDLEPTKDCNGTALKDGDMVHLIKDLVVKGANFTAKRGTPVRNISLTSNPEHIEGRVNGTRIVLVAAYLKKSV
ncbi:PhnA domain-containing protein [Thalassotalea atypica]|uniref:PhnA domain-containing protein n=1 Tax=Thalassotalea atypica TaxID=2054316 RepID=UPI002574031D|nr:alkylphosphonate utilization protein [Thalassotalea atypica]